MSDDVDVKSVFGKVTQYIIAGGTVIGLIAGGIIWMFSTFASAADIQRLERAQTIQFDTLRKEKYEEKLLELRSIASPSQAQKAQIKYYEDKLKEVNDRMLKNGVQ